MKSIHDPTYYKKMWKRDTKAIRDLTGHGRGRVSFRIPGVKKKRKYKKKGNPYKLNPSKRRGASNLSAPPGAMEEADVLKEAGTDNNKFAALLNQAEAGSTLIVVTKEDICSPGKCGGTWAQTLFSKGHQYGAKIINNNKIEIQRNVIVVGDENPNVKVTKIKEKSDIVAALSKGGEICNILDCNASKATIVRGGVSEGPDSINAWLHKEPKPGSSAPRARQPSAAVPVPGAKGPTKIRVQRGPGETGEGKRYLRGKYDKLIVALGNYAEEMGVQPLVTATPLPGVGLEKRIYGDLGAIIELDATGPGIGVTASPKSISNSALVKLLMQVEDPTVREYAKKFKELGDSAPGRAILGVEMHGFLPVPMVGLGAGKEDKAKLQRFIKKVAGEDEVDGNVLQAWFEDATGDFETELGDINSLLKIMGIDVPAGMAKVWITALPAEFRKEVQFRSSMLALFSTVMATRGVKNADLLLNFFGIEMKKLEKVTDKVKKARKLTNIIKDLQASVGTSFMFGDSQAKLSYGKAVQKKLGVPNANRVGMGSAQIFWFLRDPLAGVIKKKIQKINPNLIFIILGGNGPVDRGLPSKLIEKVMKYHPEPEKLKIVWSGPGPVIANEKGISRALWKVIENHSGKKCAGSPAACREGLDIWNKKRQKKNEVIKADLARYKNVTFVDMFDVAESVGWKDGEKVGEGWHIREPWATRFVERGIFGGPAALVAPEQIKKKVSVTSLTGGVVEAIQKSLTGQQRENATIIENIFTEAGYSKNVVAAAIANSWGEGGINQYAIGDGGSAVGLFGLHRGLGPTRTYHGLNWEMTGRTRKEFRELCHENGITNINWRAMGELHKLGKLVPFAKKRLADGDWRFDPVRNTRKILEDGGMNIVKREDAAGKSIKHLTYVFVKKVERAGIPHAVKRQKWAAGAWPGVVRFG